MSFKLVSCVFIVVFALVVFSIFDSSNWKSHPNAGLNIEQLLEDFGYKFEKHTVVTEDGYVLTLHRLPYGRNSEASNKSRTPVLLMHGIYSSGTDKVLFGSGKSIGCVLADHGYDVWIGHARGTTWSRKHKTLDPDKDKEKFWDYTFHEIGIYDVPAYIDYILLVTGKKTIMYAGISQGCAVFHIMMSEKPEYNDKVSLMISLVPGVYMGHTTSPIIRFLADHQQLWTAHWYFGFHETFANKGVTASIIRYLCHKDSPFLKLCTGIVDSISGERRKPIEEDNFSVVFTNFPAGISVKQFHQYLQVTFSGDFLKYDYGSERNIALYGTERPPPYNISRTTVPVAVFYGDNDILMTAEASRRLIKQLPNVIESHELEDVNHFDVILADDVYDFLYVHILAVMNKFELKYIFFPYLLRQQIQVKRNA